ncbi:MAG TPA: phosphate ABC transporter permease PtsA [Syntrophomonas wolfei]|uniref:Phosphate transport system permease protein PstA n=1 Tax=Syntrophomonas wolfei TaxID=863 RepID=A0A354YYT5_9FIRM|nr:phosphate ABC transporter permease PtsA [Syntrophomonas wolfei]
MPVWLNIWLKGGKGVLDYQKLRDGTGHVLAWLFSSLSIVACLSIIFYLFIRGFAQINPDFILTPPNPTLNQDMSGGISTPIAGTFLLTLTGILLAAPWALATAIYLAEYGGSQAMVQIFRLAIDVLAGVPTIVIAIFGLAIFSLPQLGFLSSMVEGVDGVERSFGRSFLVTGITMAIMILPFVIKICEEALKAVPNYYREAALSMGASKWQSIVTVVLPSARQGILTGIILGMGRIIGDTAIVWLTLGGTIRMTGIQPWWYPVHWWSTLCNTGSTLTSYIYFASPAGEGNMPDKAFGAALVLIILIIVLNIFTDLLERFGANKIKGN